MRHIARRPPAPPQARTSHAAFATRRPASMPCAATHTLARTTQVPEMNYQAIRNMLGKFGLPGDKAVQKIDTLSGGQKARVVFVEMGLKRCHILLLDEPTNHLDLETVRAAGPGADVGEG